MPIALRPQALMAFKLSDEILPYEHRFPFKLRIRPQLGFKKPQFVTTLYGTEKRPRRFRTDRGYNGFSGS